jgi:3-isopropylmalate/(R)-2-methylmalate dehydratase large subunit
MPKLLDKIWTSHVVASGEDGEDLLYVDRHLVHEVTSPQAFEGLRRAGRSVRRPDLTFAVADHVVPTTPGRGRPLSDSTAEDLLRALERNCKEFRVPLIGMDHTCQGVVHVAMPELGLILPGQTVFCGDSHTATHGAFGALAFGIGTTEVEHILATQCLWQSKPSTLAVRVEYSLGRRVAAKDLILRIIRDLGVDGGVGRVIEYGGPVVKRLSMEERMTLANMSVECGAKAGLIHPDETTFAYLEGRPYAPKGRDFQLAVDYWRTLPSDPGESFDRTLEVDASRIVPQVTWGTTPADVAEITGEVPDPDSFADQDRAKAVRAALDYMGLEPGTPFRKIPVDTVFIGSCTNGRISDLRDAASIVEGRRIASGVTGLVVPGSGAVKRKAEAEGLDRVFTDAGFEWREPGCSMCLAMNPDVLAPGGRCASTTNRNFEDRQGRGGRTHLVSPFTAAATALTGRLTDPRRIG